MKKLFFLFAFLCLCISLSAQSIPGTPNFTFNPNDRGYSNAEYALSGGFNDVVLDFDTLSDGRLIVVGNFQKFNGLTAKYIIRLTREGQIDTTFNYGLVGVNGTITDVCVTPSDSIIIAGSFTTYNGATVKGVALLDKDGFLNTSFISNILLSPLSGASAVTYDLNGNYIIASKYNTTYTQLYKVGKTGIYDTVFSANTGAGFTGYSTNNMVRRLLVDNNNKIIVCGLFSGYNGVASPRCIIRLNNDGTKDATFTETVGAFPVTMSASNAGVFDIKPYGNNQYVVAGCFDKYGPSGFANGLVIINQDGTRDNSFQDWVYYGDTTLRITAIEVLTNGKIVAGTQLFRNPPITAPYNIFVFNPNGTLDVVFPQPTFGGLGVGALAYTKIVLRGSKLIFSGYMSGYKGAPRNRLMMTELNGDLCPEVYGYSGADQLVTRIVSYPDNDTIPGNNSLLVAGSFFRYNNGDYNRIVKIKPNGTIDTTFNPGSGFSNYIREIQIDSLGKIYAGGNFTTFNGATCNRIVRLNANGSRDNTFAIGTGFNGSVSDIQLLPGGKLIVTGNFTSYNGTTCNRVAKLLYNGTIDPSFTGSGFDYYPDVVKLTNTNELVFGGWFTTYNGQACKRVIKTDINGNFISAFQAPVINYISNPANGIIRAIENFGTDLYVTGNYGVGTGADSLTTVCIAKLNAATGALDTSFNVPISQLYSKQSIYSIKQQMDGKFLIGGLFDTIYTTPLSRLARLMPDGSIDTSFAIGPGVQSVSDYAHVYEVSLLANGRIYLGGIFSNVNGKKSSNIACLRNSMLITGNPGDTLFRTNSGYCQGATLNVPVTAIGDYNLNNTFIIQLSDTNGSFNNAVNIGSINGSQSAIIQATLPANIPLAPGYKIRAIATSPYIIGTASTAIIDITQQLPANGSFTSMIDTVEQGQNSVAYSTSFNYATNYTWLYSGTGATINNNNNIATINFSNTATSGILSVIGQNPCGNDTVQVNITVLDPLGITTANATNTQVYSYNNTLVVDAPYNVNLTVFNAVGQQILPAQNVLKGRTEIALPSVTSGIYLVRLTDGKTTVTRKIVISN